MLRVLVLSVLMGVPAAAGADPAGRIRVIDADTWSVGGETVRLFGIDAVESEQTCRTDTGAVWACGDWVTREVRKLFQGKFSALRQFCRSQLNK